MTSVATTGPRTAAAIAQKCIGEGADLILAAGGDGTINEVVNGMVHSAVPLCILPAGTANVLAAELGVGKSMIRVAERLAEYRPEMIALGRLESAFEQRHFILMAGVGLDAMIVYNLNANLKSRLGKVAYWVAGFSQFGKKLPQFEVRVDGRHLRCSFALASRVRNYGGDLWIARNASLFRDSFELVLFQGEDTRPYMRYLFGIVSNRLPLMKGVTTISAQDVEICCAEDPRIYVQVDGERAGTLPAHLRIVPRSLTILVPTQYSRKPADVNG